MWTYSQTSGQIAQDGVIAGVAYSGNGAGLDNPAMQDVPCVGPIPQGRWQIGAPFVDPLKGPLVMHLMPQPGTETFDRNGFLIHGDNPQMNHTASEGCIIAGHVIRQMIADSGDQDLTVTV